MATLSDLIDQGSHSHAPGWLDMLGQSQGFCEGAVWQARAVAPETTSDEASITARAFAEGEAAGRAAAEADHARAMAEMQAVRSAFAALDKSASEALAQELAQTVLALCASVLGEYAIDPAPLEQRCVSAAARFGGMAGACRLHLHPADIALLGDEARQAWDIIPDHALERGALRLEGADGAMADGPAEWQQAIARALQL